MSKPSFLAELKRRNVIRMAGLYLVGAWLIVQVSSTVLPMFDASAWLPRSIVILLAVGFIPALIFSWVFELTSAGLKRDAEAKPGESIAPQTARRMDRMIIAVLICALVYFAVDKFVLAPRRDAVVASVPALPVTQAIVSKSIAVLPFSDLSQGHDQEYFSDGMAEEILNALAQVRDLKVAGRTSSFYYKGRNEDLRTIGKTLGVANILEGSVRKQGDKVRITAQLIQVSDDTHLWSHAYDGDLSNVFQLQEDIARAITEQLQVVLQGDQNARLAVKTTNNVEAYQQYLRGRYFFYRRGYTNLQNAIVAFKAALEMDPGYADAWAGLAQTYAIFSEYSAYDPDSKQQVDTSALALEATEHALALDTESTGALLARAYVRSVSQFDWAGAEADYQLAIARNPRDATAHQWYGEFFTYQKRWREAAAQFDQAIALDPLAPVIQQGRGVAADEHGQFEQALVYLNESLRLAPGFYNAAVENVEDLVELGRFDQAVAAVQNLPDDRRTTLLQVIAALQDSAQTNDVVKRLQAHPLGSTDQAWALAKLGKYDLALADLERMFRVGDPTRIYLYEVAALEPLYSEPRFLALVRQLNLPAPTIEKASGQP